MMLKLPQPLVDPQHPTEAEFWAAAWWGIAQYPTKAEFLAAAWWGIATPI